MEVEDDKPVTTTGRPSRAASAAGSKRRRQADEEPEIDLSDQESEEENIKTKKTPARKASPATKKEKVATPATAKKSPAPKKEKAAPASSSTSKSKPPANKKAKVIVESGEGGEEGVIVTKAVTRKPKELKPFELIEEAMKAYKWWDAEALAKGINWRVLEHCGVCFPPSYVPHGVKMKYEGREIELTSELEEMATFYASIAEDGPQLGNPATAKIFNTNFWKDFKSMLGPEHVIQKFSLCDFGPIRLHLAKQRDEKKALPKEVKEAEKVAKMETQAKHGFALIDGHLEKMGNYTVEPPGLFRGRGMHPKMGTLKKRVNPEEITINVAAAAVVPPCPIPGHNWRRVVHDPTVTWLAYWKENVMGSSKYVHLAASSSFKGKSDREKYEKARRLKQHISSIRAHYEKLLQSEDEYDRQSGTAMWVIDRLALRVGGEKDEDEADTVGCCSLRREHLDFPSNHEVTFDFLGKDSMRYHQTVDFLRYDRIGALVYRNLHQFWNKKKEGEDVFDQLTPARLNEQLNALMPGLSAKVFRTYNASYTLEKELEALPIDMPAAEKVLEYNRANREVAILCNHQRTVPKAFAAQWEKMTLREKLLGDQEEALKQMLADVKKGKQVKVKDTADPEPLAGETLDDAKKRVKEDQAHLFARQPTASEVEGRISSWKEKIEKLRLDMRNRDENKAVALGTSKINYMDPRITVAWCKKVELPIEKVFAKTLRDKFPWAMGVASTYEF